MKIADLCSNEAIAVLTCLESMKEKRPEPHFGICFNLDNMLFRTPNGRRVDAYKIVSDNCRDWLYFSGHASWPIEEEHYPDYYRDTWKYRGLVQRLSLIDHLIAKLKENLCQS